MEVTLEAIIAIAALIVGLPPTVFILWKCWYRRRAERNRDTRSTSAAVPFEILPREERMIWPEPTSMPPPRTWTLVGFQVHMLREQMGGPRWNQNGGPETYHLGARWA
ncbi:ubiquitin-like protein [Colletotrichum plurivorum]|uniref:Ubiquitin-like protein n=1 Tax=Colletotrichum plurivorum TaxID=2175906 RepID=A0A8H6KJ96_9PEZI|nr:ubiquitin-like protein [Colletotrichum plurivorum]